MRRTALPLIAILVAAFTLAACGDSAPTKSEYKKDFTPINEQIKGIGSSIADAVVNAKTKTDQELATQFGDLADQARDAAAKLGELDPPSEVEADQEALFAAVNQGARDLDSIAAAAASGNAKAAGAATVRLAANADDVRKPRQRIEKTLAEE